MNILYQIPSLHTVYAGRTIYNGYKNAWEDLGHNFKPLTMEDRAEEVFEKFQPDILFTGIGPYVLKYLDLGLVKKYKQKGMKVFVSNPYWTYPYKNKKINESPGISQVPEYVKLIKSGNFGDIYYNVFESNDARMEGFELNTGYKHHVVPLAVDKISLKPEYNQKFNSEIAFVGTYSSAKRDFFKEYVFPLQTQYNLKLYGQDWTAVDRILGWIQRGGQYFNLPYLKSFRKPKLQLDEEAKIYYSSTISINVHEDHQRKYGGDCNERTFKIPFCNGFEITDDVACIQKYFKENEEIIIARDKKDWFEKIGFFIKNPDKRLSIIQAGKKKVAEFHTYHNRVEQILKLYQTL